MINRPRYMSRLTTVAMRSPVTALLGPRQCGKTTLARVFAADERATYFDLESSVDRGRLANPELAFAELTDLVIIDEIQVLPDLLSTLRVQVV